MYSEAPFAKIVADHFKTDQHELILKEEVYAKHYEKPVFMRDSPLSEPADVPLFLWVKSDNPDLIYYLIYFFNSFIK